MKTLAHATLAVLWGLIVAGPNTVSAAESVYWRFEDGQSGQTVRSTVDESGRIEAVSSEGELVFSTDVAMPVVPLDAQASQLSVACNGGYLLAKTSPQLNIARSFTVELWAKFGTPGPSGSVLLAKGDPSEGNWHFIYQTDGTVQANIFGGPVAYLFDLESGGPVPGIWYHLAAIFEGQPDGKTRIRTFVNGHVRGGAVGTGLVDPASTDLFIGSFIEGKYPFHGMIDEVRITASVLEPKTFLLAGTRPIPEMAAVPEPIFVPAGTRIDADLRAKAAGAPILLEPSGYTYFYTGAGGPPFRLSCENVPDDCHPAFRSAMQAWHMSFCSTGSGYHFAVPTSGRFGVAIGYHDPANQPGHQVQRVVLDGQVVDTVDPAGDGRGKPFVRLYQAEDRNGDGLLEVFTRHVKQEVKAVSGQLNAIWIFSGVEAADLDAAKILHGENDIPPIYFVDCGREEKMSGHVGYPPLSPQARQNMLPMRPIPFDLDPNWPQPADPLDVEIRGELADRIQTYLDRWGYAGRDDGDRHPLGFSSDCGFEVAGRSLETIYMLSRLMKRDFQLEVPFGYLLNKQDAKSKYPGSFIGGQPLRTGFIWGQGTIFSGLMAYHELSGDQRALEAAGKLADWYESYLGSDDLAAANYFIEPKNEFSRTGATVGQLGEGALEPMLWLYWRTKDSRYLERAKRIAELKRKDGGAAWMIHGDIADEHPEYESWHLHANLSTIRGFPWLYAATGDRSYLEDAIAACDRVYDRATWGIGCVLEQIPWLRDPDPHDETCQTADELMLSYLLADFTGQGRFYDRAETIYWNAIRYMQMHRGNFTAFNHLPGPTRGGDAWFCCGWWGAKAFYETARHLYAASPTEAYINGFLPSSADLRLRNGTLHVEMQADIPRSGHVRLKLTPRNVEQFTLNVRVPGWAQFQEIRINDETIDAPVEAGYVRVARSWKEGDCVDVHFDLPLRVVLDSAWDGLNTAKVSIDGETPVETRRVLIYRGPVIVAQFRLANGVDLNWAYTGDHPDLFETLNSAADRFSLREEQFASNTGPALTLITNAAEGVKLEWGWKPGPGWSCSVRRSALVRPTIPVEIDFAAEITLPSFSPEEMDQVCKSARLCGVRMRTGGFVDYKKARLSIGGETVESVADAGKPLSGRDTMLDNGYVQFHVTSELNDLVTDNDPAFGYCGIYSVPVRQNDRQITASCKLTITGQSQFHMPMIGAGK